MKCLNRLIRALLTVAGIFIVICACSLTVNADSQKAENMNVQVNGEQYKTVKIITVAYDNNEFVSLKDIAAILDGTECEFDIAVTKSSINIVSERINTVFANEIKAEDEEEKAFEADPLNEVTGWTDEELAKYTSHNVGLNAIYLNNQERKYYTAIIETNDGYDAFISFADLCMLLDINAYQDEEDNTIINTKDSLQPVNPLLLESDGFFQGVNSVLVGDATTGEIFYSYNADKIYPIASTTKLMTYLLTMDAISAGQLSYSDVVPLSPNAVALSKTSDGVIPMKNGMTMSVKELIIGALLPSSNECALALAESIDGSEENFVNHMNQKAAELSMNSATFYNPNGLPLYTDGIIPAKLQNNMTSMDMFTMVAAILNSYPEVKDITSIRKYKFADNDLEIKNTNALLYNIPEVNGLKTGTTTKSGACLVSSLTVSDGATDHDVVVVLLGAEGSQERIRVSEIMARYGIAVVKGEASAVSAESENEIGSSVKSAEGLVNLIVNSIIKMK